MIMDKFLLTIELCSLLSVLTINKAYGETISLSEGGKNELTIKSSSCEKIIFDLNINDFVRDKVMIDEKEFFLVSTGGEGTFNLKKGYPNVPHLTRSIEIPTSSDYFLRVIDSKYKDYYMPIAPSKGSLSRKINPSEVPYTFDDVYKKDEFYPSQTAVLGKPYMIRSTNGVALTFYPFQYNPVKKVLRVYSYMSVEVEFKKMDGKNSSTVPAGKNKAFEPILKNHFVNHIDLQSVAKMQNGVKRVSQLEISENPNEIPKMLIICYDDFVERPFNYQYYPFTYPYGYIDYINGMVDFVKHKNNLGIPTSLVKMSEVGTTSDDIKNYIQNAYINDSTLTYVLLVGNDSLVPSPICESNFYHQVGGADPIYSLVSGDDFYPDLIVGRFCVQSIYEARNMADRVIKYENTHEEPWFHKGIGIANKEDGIDFGDNGDDNESDHEHMRNIRDTLLNSHFDYIYELYEGSQGGIDSDGDPTREDLINALNGGAAIINYIGHGEQEKFTTTGFSTNDTGSLSNENKLPFVFSVACLVGDFTNTDTCLAKALLHWNTSNGKNTGAIGFYGSSISQRWAPPMEAQDCFNSRLANLADNELSSWGALCYSSSCSMMDNYPAYDVTASLYLGDSVLDLGDVSMGEETFLTWNYFGDPSLAVIPNNNVGKTLFIHDNVYESSTFSHKIIDVKNAQIRQNNNIVFDHQEYTVIQGFFLTQSGSTLQIK
jgi:gingipain R